MNLNEKYLKKYIELGYYLIRKGIWFVQKAFKLGKLRKINQSYVRSLMQSKGFDDLKFADGTYYLPTIQQMKKIIKYDWVDQKKYLTDRYDCDNYAETFRALTHIIYEMNNVALSKHIKVTLSNDRTTYHRACTFLAVDDDVIKLYFLETQNDKLIELTDNNPFLLGNWGYMLNLIEF